MANTKIAVTVDTSYLEATLTELRTLYADRLEDLEYEYQRRIAAEAALERIGEIMGVDVHSLLQSSQAQP